MNNEDFNALKNKASKVQNECHELIDVLRKDNPNLPYEDILTTFLFFKIAELTQRIEELELNQKLKI